MIRLTPKKQWFSLGLRHQHGGQKPSYWGAWMVMLIMGVSACGGGTNVQDTTSRGGSGTTASAFVWALPANFPVPKVPDDNPMSNEKVELGRYLFYDKRLSGNGQQSCASCHQQDKAFTDGRPLAIGSTGEVHPRSAQHLGNVAYNATLTWANPSLVTLEKQMEVPLFGVDPVEMGINDGNKDQVLARLKADARTVAQFKQAFPQESDPIHFANIIKAISAFQRTLISGNSRYDQYLAKKTQLSDSEIRGMNLFNGEKAECFHCHGSFNFNDQIVHSTSRLVETPFHNTGLFNIGGTGEFPVPNRGVFELTNNPKDMGAFRAPSLRNVAVTAPYMHDGSVPTLEDVLNFYGDGGRVIANGPQAGDGRANPHKSDLISRIDLTPQDKADLVAFLKTLTDEEFLKNPKFSNPFATGNPP